MTLYPEPIEPDYNPLSEEEAHGLERAQQERIAEALADMHSQGPVTEIPHWEANDGCGSETGGLALFRHVDQSCPLKSVWIVELYQVKGGCQLQAVVYNSTEHSYQPSFDCVEAELAQLPLVDDAFMQACIDDDYLAYLDGLHQLC